MESDPNTSGLYYKNKNKKSSKPKPSLIVVTFLMFLQIYPHKICKVLNIPTNIEKTTVKLGL